MERLPALADDGLLTPPVGEWAEEKYQLVRCYADIFATAMKNSFECRVYIDLFAGAGRAKLRDSQKIVAASPLVVLDIRNPFDRYVFCDIDPENLRALQARVGRDFSVVQPAYVPGDTNLNVDAILSHIPQHSKSFRVLTFCFVDPFNVDNLKFDTIARLAGGGRKIDFLLLIPSGMDAQRNWQHDNNLNAAFLGNPTWREEWEQQQRARRSFANFFVDEFAKSMRRIGFRWGGIPSTRVIKNEKNSPMYHLAFFSREEIAARFWDECKKYTADQGSFAFR